MVVGVRYMADHASLNLKLSQEMKDEFTRTAEALGMPAATALKVLVTRFILEGGFPFDVRIPNPKMNWEDPRIIRTKYKDGKLIVPSSWRDEDDDD